jgi:hypothetical protein
MGIEPLGALESAPSLVEHRVWRESKRENDGEHPITAGLEAAMGTPARGHELDSFATN